MKLIKKIGILSLAGLLSLSFVACGSKEESKDKTPTESSAPTESTDKKNEKDVVIAEVEGVPVYKSALDEQMASAEQYMVMQYGEDYKSNEEAMKQYKEQQKLTLDFLIETEMLLKKAEALDIKVDKTKIDEEFEATKATFETEEAFQEALKGSNLTEDILRKNIEKNLIIADAISRFTKDVKVEEQDKKDYYEANLATYTTGPGAVISHILVDSEEKAKAIKKEYDGGKTFEELASTHGTDGTKDTGGSLGFIAYDDPNYDADFLAAAKTLAEGKVSDPVKTQFGWHLIKADDIKKESVVKPYEEVSAAIGTSLLEEKQYASLTEQLASWKSEMKIEIFEDKLS